MHSVKALYQCRRIVAIGGGHGLGRVMASLGFLGERLSGIVATTDDGGSTGRLYRVLSAPEAFVGIALLGALVAWATRGPSARD